MKRNDETLKITYFSYLILLIGLHSIFLGSFIYFFTDLFYQKFFSADVENIFFVRQSGVFLFLAGFFYLFPLINLETHYQFVILTVFSKAIAVLFLVVNAQETLSSSMIYLAAVFDGLMGTALLVFYFQ
jgi:hypothetical protein